MLGILFLELVQVPLVMLIRSRPSIRQREQGKGQGCEPPTRKCIASPFDHLAEVVCTRDPLKETPPWDLVPALARRAQVTQQRIRVHVDAPAESPNREAACEAERRHRRL